MFAPCFPDGSLAGKSCVVARASEEHSIRPTKLFIGGITRNTSTQMLRDHFSCFGRVLDCVAMRQPDGRPRGFGYVTLDSSAAAAQYLSEPQVIDGRIVDLKPAVAEGAAGTTPMIGNDAFRRIAPDPGLGLASDHSFATLFAQAWWETSFQDARGEATDCVDPLSAYAFPALHAGPPGRFEDVSLNADVKNLCCKTAAGLSANASEFVPSNFKPCIKPSILATELSQPRKVLEPKTNKFTPWSTLGDRTPFAELTNMDAANQKISDRKPFGELTNMQSNTNGVKPLKSCDFAPTAIVGAEAPPLTRSPISRVEIPEVRSEICVLEDCELSSADGSKDIGSHCSPTNCPSQEDLHVKGSFTIFVEREFSEADVAKVSSPVESVREAGQLALESARGALATFEDDAVDNDLGQICSGELPSLGSAKHSAGECKRCNFFAKGRCLHGRKCTFCHLSHEKRKPSRQEKRERRESWLISQAESNLSEVTTTAEAYDQTQHPVSSKIGPTLVQFNNYGLHSQPASILGLQSPSCTSGSPCLLPPPGLAPPLKSLESWQPDAEVSPLCLRSLLSPCLTATTPATISAGDALGDSVLHPLADSCAPSHLFTAPSPALSSVAAVLKAAVPASWSNSSSIRTMGTQTELELMCPGCAGNSAANMVGESSAS